MDRGEWRATIHGVTKSQTCWSNWTHTHTYFSQHIYPTWHFQKCFKCTLGRCLLNQAEAEIILLFSEMCWGKHIYTKENFSSSGTKHPSLDELKSQGVSNQSGSHIWHHEPCYWIFSSLDKTKVKGGYLPQFNSCINSVVILQFMKILNIINKNICFKAIEYNFFMVQL